VELAEPIVPHLAQIGRAAGGDRTDQLLPRLRLRNVFDLQDEIFLRLVEALDQRIHQGDARRLGNAPLETHRFGAPRPARGNERSLPPGKIGRRDHARAGQRVQEPATG
jgi:hypothetical protein